MTNTIMTSGLVALTMAGTAAHAQDAGFTWGGEVEIGVDSTVKSDDPSAEITDTYISAEVEFEAVITNRVLAFGTLSLEP